MGLAHTQTGTGWHTQTGTHATVKKKKHNLRMGPILQQSKVVETSSVQH